MWTEERINALQTAPSAALIADMKKIDGDIIVLGAGGKMGPTLSVLAANAIKEAGIQKRVIAVSRFSDPIALEYLKQYGVETISADLLDADALDTLPDVKNVIYMAGRKFGTQGGEHLTWAMNASLPAFVARKYKASRIVAFSSGNVYPIVPLSHGPCTEEVSPAPIGEYAMSVLARERAFEYASREYGTKVFNFRLCFSVDLRYGVLYDCAQKILSGTPISLENPVLNCIWQGTAIENALRALLLAKSPMCTMNIVGPETLSVRSICETLGTLLGKKPVYAGEEGDSAYIFSGKRMCDTFGMPAVNAETLIRWQAEYILDGARTLNKPTHFEERKGSY